MTGNLIAFYNSTDCFSGLEKSTLRNIEWLVQDGNEILIISTQGTPFTIAARQKGFKVVELDKAEKYFSITKSYRLARRLKTLQIRLVVVVRPRNILMTGLTKIVFYRRLKLVFFQQSTVDLKPHPVLYHLLFRPFDAWIVPAVYLSKKLVTITRYKPEKMHVIPPGIDIAFVEHDTITKQSARRLLNLPEPRVILGSFGKYDVTRKHDYLIRALQLLHKNNYDLNLLIMGDPLNEKEKADFDFLNELVMECGMESKVYFRPYSDKLIPFFRAIDMFVLNIPTEPFDHTLINAMASGIPVLAVSCEHHGEVLANGNSGILFKADNLEDITAKIIHLLTQPKLVDYILKESQQQVHRLYDKHEACHKMEMLFNQMLENK